MQFLCNNCTVILDVVLCAIVACNFCMQHSAVIAGIPACWNVCSFAAFCMQKLHMKPRYNTSISVTYFVCMVDWLSILQHCLYILHSHFLCCYKFTAPALVCFSISIATIALKVIVLCSSLPLCHWWQCTWECTLYHCIMVDDYNKYWLCSKYGEWSDIMCCIPAFSCTF